MMVVAFNTEDAVALDTEGSLKGLTKTGEFITFRRMLGSEKFKKILSVEFFQIPKNIQTFKKNSENSNNFQFYYLNLFSVFNIEFDCQFEFWKFCFGHNGETLNKSIGKNPKPNLGQSLRKDLLPISPQSIQNGLGPEIT